MNGSMNALDPKGPAFGFSQRRSWVFYAWWYPAVLGLSGAVHAGLALLTQGDPELGVVLLIIGAVLAALGWAATAAPRFTRKLPRPAADIPRVEQGIRITPGIIWTVLGGTAVILLLLVLFTPKGASPETIPLLGLLAAFAGGIAIGLAYTRWLMKNSEDLYGRWLQRNQPGRGR